MGLGLHLILEDGTYQRAIRQLFDRLLSDYVEHLQGLSPTDLDFFRVWPDRYERLGSPERLLQARELGLLRGPFGGGREAVAARAALLLQEHLPANERPTCVFIGRDADRKGDRRDALVAAIRSRSWSFGVALAVGEPEAEAWFICLFVPASAREKAVLASLVEDLGFDPTTQPQRLLSNSPGDERDVKSVLRRLELGPDQQHELLELPWDLLIRRGQGTGLTSFLREAVGLLPRFGRVRPPEW